MISTNKNPINLSNYPFSVQGLSPKDIQLLDKVEERTIFEKITSDFLLNLLENFKVYLIYFESFPQSKSKIRTFKKMFYEQKTGFGKNNLLELEIDLENNQSILAAIVKANEKNLENCLKAINSNFAFGLAVRKNKKSFLPNQEQFLRQLKDFSQIDSKKINILKVLTKALNEDKIIFTFKTTGQDESIISLFSKNTHLSFFPLFVSSQTTVVCEDTNNGREN